MIKIQSNNAPDLHFYPNGNLEGFTSAGIQGFNDLNPAAIVRELIQNSLDAVREDGREEAIVRFEIEKTRLANIPAIDTYKNCFEKAKAAQAMLFDGEELPDQATAVTNTIEQCLALEDIENLYILDNGVGLDDKRMTGLLADGFSPKSSASSGAVGNGHMTVIPASDLRYVLYGGLNDGTRIASGHAVLASFEDKSKKERMGKDGYFVLNANSSFEVPYYDFPKTGAIPEYISEKLDWIEENWKAGSIVAVPGFNRFKESEDNLQTIIMTVAACNFFAAIAQGHLSIQFSENGEEHCWDKNNIARVFQGELVARKRAKNFLSGLKAAEAYQTATEGTEHTIDVGCGTVQIRLRNLLSGGRSRIDLCRNGMWINDHLPRLQTSKFSDFKPFHCLILLSFNDGEIHKLVRKSEGPLHNHIEAKKWLTDDEGRKLKGAFSKISDFLLDNLEKLETESFIVSDYLTVLSEEGVLSGGQRLGGIGKFEPVEPRPSRTPSRAGKTEGGHGDNGGNGNGESQVNAFNKTGRNIPFGAVPVPTGRRSYAIELIPQDDQKKSSEAEIRFVLDENLDETCVGSNDEQFVKLANIKMDGKQVSQSNLVKKDDDILGVRLGQLRNGETINLTFDYELPDNVNLQENAHVVLRAEIVGRKTDAS